MYSLSIAIISVAEKFVRGRIVIDILSIHPNSIILQIITLFALTVYHHHSSYKKEKTIKSFSSERQLLIRLIMF